MGLYSILSIFFAIGGLIILSIAISRRRSVLRRRSRTTAQAKAVVAKELIHLDKPGTRSTFHYIYEFSVNGSPQRAQAAGRRHWKEGDRVSILYDPDHPEIICVPEAQSWQAIIALYIIGSLWLFSAVMLVIYDLLGIQ